ncbi:MAG: LLM class flavin-dependent oxidoreductase [Candidatus Dormiibacterota bacterium]
MPALARAVGLGLNAQGEVRDAVQQAEMAERSGLDSIWFHESYFARDAVTYATAVAASVPRLRICLGALNPNTRNQVVLAMTVSALDDLAPGRVTLALGTALPLRLAQMGIPYEPEVAVAKVGRTMEELRLLWRGERLALGGPGVPDVEPMFPPVHQVPLWAAGYRRSFHELAGRLADGYLARPAEPLEAVGLAAKRIRAAAELAGRDPASISIGGYLLSLIDSSHRAALDRAKREPFAIYMLAVQTDVAMRRAGMDPSLRQPILAAWRAEDYHGAAQLIPDELVDAFLLCGTREEVAAGAERFRQAGMDLPILQPVVQEDAQVAAVIEAAVIYGSAGAVAPAWGSRQRPAESTDKIGLLRRSRGWLEITRPFALTASIVPVSAAAALAAERPGFSWTLFALVLVGAVMLQVGTNVINEIYDVRKGIDAITSPRASQALLTGRVREREAFLLAGTALLAATLIGVVLILTRGWPLLVFGAIGLIGGWGYTAPPLQYKYRAAGLPLVFVLMGPLMVLGAYFTISGHLAVAAWAVSLPIGLLVTAILHGNEWRDIGEDARAGISTLSIRAGRQVAHHLYVSLLVGAFVTLALAVAVGLLPRLSLLALLSLPLLVRSLNASELGAAGQQRAIAMIDLETAQLHAAFGLLLAAGIALSVTWHPGG